MQHYPNDQNRQLVYWYSDMIANIIIYHVKGNRVTFDKKVYRTIYSVHWPTPTAHQDNRVFERNVFISMWMFWAHLDIQDAVNKLKVLHHWKAHGIVSPMAKPFWFWTSSTICKYYTNLWYDHLMYFCTQSITRYKLWVMSQIEF